MNGESSDNPPTITGNHTVNGRFALGNSGGPGDPHRKHSAMLRAAFHAANTPEDMTEAAKVCKTLALSGDMAAMKLWLEYLLGKPPQAVELSGSEGGPLVVQLVWPDGKPEKPA